VQPDTGFRLATACSHPVANHLVVSMGVSNRPRDRVEIETMLSAMTDNAAEALGSSGSPVTEIPGMTESHSLPHPQPRSLEKCEFDDLAAGH